MNEFRYSDFEFRQSEDGLGVVAGTVIRYGDVATLPWGTEEFTGRRVRRLSQPLGSRSIACINARKCLRGSVGRLEIEDDDERMAFSLTLPDTVAGRDTATEMREELLTGASLEFRAIEDSERRHRPSDYLAGPSCSALALLMIRPIPDPSRKCVRMGTAPSTACMCQSRPMFTVSWRPAVVVPEPVEDKPVTTQKSRRYFVMV